MDVILVILGIVGWALAIVQSLQARRLGKRAEHLKEEAERLREELRQLRIGLVIKDRLKLVERWVQDARKAKNSIVAISHTVGPGSGATPEERNAWEQYLEVLKEKSGEGVRIRILATKKNDRIPGLLRRDKAGAKIKVSPRVENCDFRFQICDDERMVLNVPSVETDDMTSRAGYVIPVKDVCELCSKLFDREWEDPEAQTFDDFVKEVNHQG